TDRSWMIFFAGLVVLLPIAFALTMPEPAPGLSRGRAGLWGDVIGVWWQECFGTCGAWFFVALAGSVLMAATLAWNPVRALVGKSPKPALAGAAALAPLDAPSQPAPKK